MGNFVNIWDANGFSPSQGSFQLLHEFTLILKSKWRDLNSRLGGCGIYVSEIYFSIFLKNKEEEKDWSVPQSDSTIQPKARGLLHMEREYFAHHIWSRFRGLSISQPRATTSTWGTTRRTWRKAQKQSEECFDYLKYLKTPCHVLDAYRTRLRRARGLVRPEVAGLLIGIECSRVRDRSWMCLTSLVTVRIGVELAVVQENYLIRL